VKRGGEKRERKGRKKGVEEGKKAPFPPFFASSTPHFRLFFPGGKRGRRGGQKRAERSRAPRREFVGNSGKENGARYVYIYIYITWIYIYIYNLGR
jgi:hypothetical protein